MPTLPQSHGPNGPEKRRKPRRRVLQGGKIYIGAFNPTIIDCLVTDVSETGARLELHGGPILTAEAFEIRIGTGELRRVQLRWASPKALGVEFLDTPP